MLQQLPVDWGAAGSLGKDVKAVGLGSVGSMGHMVTLFITSYKVTPPHGCHHATLI